MSNPNVKFFGKISSPFNTDNLLTLIQSKIPTTISTPIINQLNIYYNILSSVNPFDKPTIEFTINNENFKLSPSMDTLQLENINLTSFYITSPSNYNTIKNIEIIFGVK